MPDANIYPASPAARDRFVLGRRGSRPEHHPWRYQGLIVEDERAADGTVDRIATVFLTGRECPWRCAMCDLWKYTTAGDTPLGAIPAQIAATRTVLRDRGDAISGMKLYNAGSFFDPRAVPEADYDGIAAALDVSHVIVESHPALVGVRVDQLRAALDRYPGDSGRPATLEVAMGLETAHPQALAALNKRFTFDDFAAAAGALRARSVSVRVFLLIFPPFVPADEQDEWLLQSLDAALACDASVVSLVPTRAGNGTIEALAASGLFHPASLDDIERSFALALTHAAGRARVFVDLWDLDQFGHCACCLAWRRARLEAMNRQQAVLPGRPCPLQDRTVRS
jgi:archaeosine synthase beta-subunit